MVSVSGSSDTEDFCSIWVLHDTENSIGSDTETQLSVMNTGPRDCVFHV